MLLVGSLLEDSVDDLRTWPAGLLCFAVLLRDDAGAGDDVNDGLDSGDGDPFGPFHPCLLANADRDALEASKS